MGVGHETNVIFSLYQVYIILFYLKIKQSIRGKNP